MKLITLTLTALYVNNAAFASLIDIDSSRADKKYHQERLAHEQVSFISASRQQHQKSGIPKNNDETNISSGRDLAKGKKGTAVTGGGSKKGKKGTVVGAQSGKKEKGKKTKGKKSGINKVEGNLSTSAPNTPDAKSDKVAVLGGLENSTTDIYTPTPSRAPGVQPITPSSTLSPSNSVTVPPRTRSPTIMQGPDDEPSNPAGEQPTTEIDGDFTGTSADEPFNPAGDQPTTEIDGDSLGTGADGPSVPSLAPTPGKPTGKRPFIPDEDKTSSPVSEPTPISTIGTDGDFTGTGADEPFNPAGDQPTTEIDGDSLGTGADGPSVPSLAPTPGKPTGKRPFIPDEDKTSSPVSEPTPISTIETDGDFTGTGADEPFNPAGDQPTTEIDGDSLGTGADGPSVPSLAPTPGKPTGKRPFIPDEDKTSSPVSEPTPISTIETDGDFTGTGADEPFNPAPAPTFKSKLNGSNLWDSVPGPTPVQEPNTGPSPFTLNDLLDNDESVDGSGRGEEDRDRDRDEGIGENSERENGNENPYFLCFGANTTGSVVVPVNFQYILTVSTSDENAVNSLLQYVEGQLLEAVENAGLCARRLEKSNDPLQGRRRLSGVVEVSSLPEDRPNYDINCGTNCIVVDGGMTLEVEGGMDETDSECQIIDIVRGSMRDLVGASFLESEAICVSANGAEEDESPGGGPLLRGGSSDSFPIGVTTTIAVGAVALVVAAYVFATRRGGQDDGDYETIFSNRAPGTMTIDSKDEDSMSPPMTSCDVGAQSPISGYVYSVDPALSPESLLTPRSCETRSSISSSPDEQLLCHELCDDSPKVVVESVEKEENSIDGGDVHQRSYITNTSFSINDSVTTVSQASGSPRNLGIRPSPEEAEWNGDSGIPESLLKSDPSFNPDSSFAPEEGDILDLLPDGTTPGESEDQVEPISKLRSIPTMTPIKENSSNENDQSAISVPCDESDVTHDSFEELRGSYLPQKYDYASEAKEKSSSASSP